MTDEKTLKSIQLQKLDDRAIWYGRQYWQVPMVFLGGVGLVVVQAVDKASAYPTLVPWVGGLGGIAGLFIWWHMYMIDKNFARLVDDIIRLEKELGVRNSCDRKSATQPEGAPYDHRSPMLWLQRATTLALLGWAVAAFLQCP